MTKKARAVVYVGELGRCAVPGIGAEFFRERPIRITEDGWEPANGEPKITAAEAEYLVSQFRTVGYMMVDDEYRKVVTEPFRIINIRVRDEEAEKWRDTQPR